MTPRVPRNLFLVGLVSLLMDLSSEMVFPLLPVFLASLGAGGVAVGVMEGAADTVASFLKYASGRWSDARRKRKGFALFGYGMSAISKAGYLAATAPFHVVALRSIDRVGKGVRGAPRDALIAESVDARRWGFAFGVHRALDTTGALLGPLLGIVLLAAGLGLRDIFAVALVPAGLSVLVLTLVREPAATAPRATIEPVRTLLKGPLFSYLFTIAVFSLSAFGLLFLLLRATTVGLPMRDVLVIFALYNLVYAVLALPSGALTDRIGRVPLVALAFAFQSGAALVAVRLASDSLADFVAPAALFGIASALWEGNGRALATDLAPPHARATVLGAYHAAIGLASLPAGLLAGLLWDIHWQLPFLTGALFAGVALLELLWLWGKRSLERPAHSLRPMP